MKKLIEPEDIRWRGLGDFVEDVFKFLRIDSLYHYFVKDCGCKKRQKILNYYFPFWTQWKFNKQQEARYPELTPPKKTRNRWQ